MTRRLVPLAFLAVLLAGCGGGGSSEPDFPTIGAARTFELSGFEPARPIQPGTPTPISFAIRQPDGTPLTRFKSGAGPHTGVHLIFVRDDLGEIIHKHPPVAADGTIRESVTFPGPGRYRLVVDAYPATGRQPNFQLFHQLRVAGTGKAAPLPPPSQVVESGGYRFTIRGKPRLEAVQASLLDVDVTDAQGRPAAFKPYFGALAHAIFFRADSLDYFHTHVCAPGATGCTSQLGSAQVTGTSATPGDLELGVLLPVAGTWRLFVQTKVNGKVLTAPFTLTVS